MRLNESLSMRGYFWMDGNTEVKSIGVLRIENGGTAILELTKSLEKSYSVPTPDDEDIGTIFGLTDTYGHVMLTECRYTERNMSFAMLSPICIECKYCLLNIDIENSDFQNLIFKEVYFSADNLCEWLNIQDISVIRDKNSKTVTIAINDDIKLYEKDGLNIYLSQKNTIKNGQISSLHISNKYYFRITSNEQRHISFFTRYFYTLVNLLSLSMDRTVSIDEIFIEYNSQSSDRECLAFYESLPFN